MTRDQFLQVDAYLTCATNKVLTREAKEVYYDLLGDLDADVFRLAAKQVALSHVWATYPSAAELRQAAATITQGCVKRLSAAEAWKIAWDAASEIDLDMHGEHVGRDGKTYPTQAASVLARVPKLVLEAMQTYGLPSLCVTSDVGIARAQFMRIWDQLAERDAAKALLPPDLVKAIEGTPARLQGAKSLPAAAQRLLDGIGRDVR